VSAAREFEAQMMKELLKPLTEASELSQDESTDSSSSVLHEFAAEALGRALSARGGLGIAREIVHTLSQPGNVPDREAMSRMSKKNTDSERLNDYSVGKNGR
jgi:Rod binding domain-containing protein